MSTELIDLLAQIIGDRIISKGLNPKTNQPFQLTDIKIPEVETATENYILTKQGVI